MNDEVEHHEFHSDDPDEVSSFISTIYADNQFEAQHAVRRDVAMYGLEWYGTGIYDVDYQMPFRFKSEEARQNYLFLTCNRGESHYRSSDRSHACRIDDVMPISSASNSLCETGPEGVGHLSVIISSQKLNDFVAQWVGRPQTKPIEFALAPLASGVAEQWNLAAACFRQLMQMTPMPSMAAESLLEHMFRTVVLGHAHNVSEALKNMPHANEDQTRKAIKMIQHDPIRWKLLGALAHALGCATGALEHGILRLTGRRAQDLIYDARMNALRNALRKSGDRSFVGIIRDHGFTLTERFIGEYTRLFQEPPSATYRRNHNAEDIAVELSSDPLSRKMIDEFIHASLNKPIRLGDMANLIGMSEQAAIKAFKEHFARTPMQYVIEQRLEHARWLLQHTSGSVLSIALNCGFATHGHFSTAMKAHFGVTPREMRRTFRLPRPAGDAANP